MADEQTGFLIGERCLYEGVDPTTGDRFHFRAAAGEVRIPKNEREEQALRGLVDLGVAEQIEVTSQADAKQGGSRKNALKPPSKPEATEAELAEDLDDEVTTTESSQTEGDGESQEPQDNDDEDQATDDGEPGFSEEGQE
ncbi:MAG: hypothetical protein ACRDH8_12975 [Actinomycetota bacterium]